MSGQRILVADDDKDSADGLGLLLAGMGHEVRTAYDGLAAVEEATAFEPDVILLDVGMPKLNGYEAARRIRRERRSKPVVLIAVTGFGAESESEFSRRAGFDFHLVKPVDTAQLRKLLSHGSEASKPAT